MAENNRDKLIKAAARLFMRFGFHGTSVDEILSESGVAKSNFYYHFESKDELARAVTEYWIDDYNETLIAPSLGDDAPDVWTSLRVLFDRAAASQDPSVGLVGCPLGRITSELAGEMPGVREKLDSYFSSVTDRVADLLCTRGVTRALAEGQASAVVAVLEGGLLLSGLRSDGNQVKRPGHALVDLLEASHEES